MAEHPIIFQDQSVHASRAGLKTQTRRVVQVQPERQGPWWIVRPPQGQLLLLSKKLCSEFRTNSKAEVSNALASLRCPYGEPGDLLWVKETWRAEELESGLDGVRYRADDAFVPIENTLEASEAWCNARGLRSSAKWRSPLFMPRWASRDAYRVVSARVQRVQDITEEDALAEGVDRTIMLPGDQYSYVASFGMLWDSNNAKPRARKHNGKITHYESFTWKDIYEVREYRGKPHYVYGNPWVWAVEYNKEDTDG